MHILLVVPLYPPTVGGAELQAQGLARELDSKGVRVTVLTRPCANQEAADSDRGIRIVRQLSAVPLGPLWGLTYMMSASRWARRLSVSWDVIHNQQVGLHSWATARAANSLHKPCLLRFACSGPGGDLATLGQYRFGRQLLAGLHTANRFVALTPGGAAELARYGFCGERIRTIPNGVDLQRFAVQSWPRTTAAEAIRLLFVGRLEHQKGLDVLLDALTLVRRPARFYVRVVGDGSESTALRKRAHESGLSSVVEFCGRQHDMVAQYAWTEVVVLPSRFEGMPNVVLEAMACARPVLGTRVDGTADLLAAGDAGWLTPSGDSAALARQLEEIASQREHFASVGVAGRMVAEGRHSTSRIASMYLNEYEAMLSKRPVTSA
jgi:glycosyltransferase involved in cell wall biosynthesis